MARRAAGLKVRFPEPAAGVAAFGCSFRLAAERCRCASAIRARAAGDMVRLIGFAVAADATTEGEVRAASASVAD